MSQRWSDPTDYTADGLTIVPTCVSQKKKNPPKLQADFKYRFEVVP